MMIRRRIVVQSLPRYLLFPIAILVMLMTPGCLWGPFIGPGGERWFRYEITGRIAFTDGVPRASRVLVGWGQSHQFLNAAQLRRMFSDESVPTDAMGLFHCNLVRGVGPTQATFGPPTVGEVFVYVEQPDGWHVYNAQLGKDAQEKTADGRKITVPPVNAINLAIRSLSNEGFAQL